MKKKSWISIIVILLVIILAVLILTRSHPQTDGEVAKCLGTKATLYIQLGCHACKIQEDYFGEDYQYLDVVDCFFEREKCIEANIEATPTWIINGMAYKGARSVEDLKKLAGC
jgi:hypothetical protein